MVWRLAFVSKEVTIASLRKFDDTIDRTDLHGGLTFNDNDRGRNEGGRTEIKAEEMYNAQISTLQVSYVGDPPLDLMLMWLLTKRAQKKP